MASKAHRFPAVRLFRLKKGELCDMVFLSAGAGA